MPRTTPSNVAGIIEVDPNIDLTPFIAVASSLVDEQCAGVTNTTYQPITDVVRLEMIERYLAAHFYAHRDQRVQREAVGGATAYFQGKTDELYLSGSQYGQSAIILDSTGNLNRLNKMLPKHKILWLGTNHPHHHC